MFFLIACVSRFVLSAQGYKEAVWFIDPKQVDSLCSSARAKRMADAYSFEIHFPVSQTVGYCVDSYLWGCGKNANLSKHGDFKSASKWQDDLLAVPSEYCALSTCAQMFIIICDTSCSGNLLVQFAGFGKQMLQAMHKYGTTFSQIDNTLDCDNYRNIIDNVFWKTEKYSVNRGYNASSPKRHFELAPHEIDLAAFQDWLPPLSGPSEPHDISQMWGSGIEADGPVYLALGKYEEGSQRTKLALSRFQFTPVGVCCNLLSLARLLIKMGQNHEAAMCFDKALKEARRMELHMVELMLLHANQSGVFGQEHKGSKAKNVTISKMVEPAKKYSPLLSS